jgi:integrase
MPKLLARPPKYCHHKGTNQAVVYMGGKAVYLGPYNSQESKAAYAAIVGEWSGQQTSSKPVDEAPVVAAPRLTIAEALQQFKSHSERYYGVSREFDNLREALRPVRERFGWMVMSDFGPLQLRVLRNGWIEEGLARNTINARVVRLKRFFKWAVGYELIDANVLSRLNCVESLMPGRGGKETRPKLPVAWEIVEATLPHLPDMVQAMVLFGWHTGARPAEITALTTGMIDQSRDVWFAKLEKHKTAGWGHVREIPIGRMAQNVLTPWLRPNDPDEPIFSPRRVDERQNKRLDGKRPPGKVYSRAAFQQVVRRACRRAEISPAWSPNELRHAFGTRIREQAGIEASQMALGHRKPDTTLIYTGAAKERMVEAIRTLG